MGKYEMFLFIYGWMDGSQHCLCWVHNITAYFIVSECIMSLMCTKMHVNQTDQI